MAGETTLRSQARQIWEAALRAAQPDGVVERALQDIDFGARRIHLVAVGKAAAPMAARACALLGQRIADGTVITKYGHLRGAPSGLCLFEAGHPLPDENSFRATETVLQAAQGWGEGDAVLFLLSGGGSALFEKPLLEAAELQDITAQLLRCGAGIDEINCLRKRLSAVKGGRFAALCAPARVYSVILSDVLGDAADAVASGPACVDASTCAQALSIAEKYALALSPRALSLLRQETPRTLDNIEVYLSGSVRQLCAAAQETCRALGYETLLLTDSLACQAREAGAFLGAIARSHAADGRSLAFLAGGETVVTLTGSGLGGRNQELALSAAPYLAGLPGAALFSLGSDGTDGPTDAAGAYVDGGTAAALRALGVDIPAVLRNNDSYHALAKADALIFTGPTGTNVNDLTVLLLRGGDNTNI